METRRLGRPNARMWRTISLLAVQLGVVAGVGIADPGDATPDQVAIGDRFAIEAPGIESGRGRARLLLTREGARSALARVHDIAGDGTVTASVRRGDAGVYDVRLRRGRFDDLEVPGGLTIRGPAPEVVTPARAARRSRVLVLGEFFGTRRGSVRVDGRRARVIRWFPDSVEFQVPRRASVGLVDVEVRARAGSALIEGQLEVLEGIAAAEPQFDAFFLGRGLSITGSEFVEAGYSESLQTLIVTATHVDGTLETSITLVADFDFDRAVVPVNVTEQPVSPAIHVFRFQPGEPGIFESYDSGPAGEWSLTLARSRGRVIGVARGSVRQDDFGGPDGRGTPTPFQALFNVEVERLD